MEASTDKFTLCAGLDILNTLLSNVVKQPGEAKFRKINAANEKIRSSVFLIPKVHELLLLLGYKQQNEAYVLDGSDLRLVNSTLKQIAPILADLKLQTSPAAIQGAIAHEDMMAVRKQKEMAEKLQKASI